MAYDLERLRSRLAESPDDVETLEALEAALVEVQDWPGLAALTAERAARVSPEEAHELWVRLVQGLEGMLDEVAPEVASAILVVTAGVAEERLTLRDDAIMRYQAAYQRNPSNVEALRLARALYERDEKWELVVQLYQFEAAALAEPSETATVYLDMAGVLVDRLDRTADALVCVRQARKLDPEHAGLARYVDLLESASSTQLAQIDALVEEARAARDARKKAALLTQAARALFEVDGADDRIVEILREALDADARNDDARVLIEHFYETNGQWADLVTWLEERAKATARKSDRQTILQRLAVIAHEALNDPERAVAWHREVLQLSPVETDSLNYCVDHYSDREQWRELVEVYEAALRVRTTGGNDGAMLVQIAMILWRKIADLDAAENYFKRIKLNDPRNGLMLQFYTEYFAAKADYKKLLNTLGTRQNVETTDEGRVAVGLQMARLAENELANPEKAIDVWKSILKIDPDHEESRLALRRLFVETRKYNALLEFLKDEQKRIGDADVAGQVALQLQVVEIYRDHLKLPVMVVNTYNQILQIDPANTDALDALEVTYEEGARWNDLVNVLDKRVELAEAAGDTEALIGLHRRVAALWMDRFSNPAQAVAHYETLLTHAPTDADAIARLTEIHKQRRDHGALFELYGREVEGLEGAARVARLVEMAEIAAQKLDAPEQAVGLWQRVVAEDPQNEAAWDALEGLYAQAEAFPELAELYAHRGEATAAPAAKAGWLRKLALVVGEQLADEDRAAEVWLAVLDLDPADADGEQFLRLLYLERGDWDGLTALYARRGDWAGLVEQLVDVVDLTEDLDVRVELWRRVARVQELRLGDVPAAVASWERVLDEVPDHAEAAAVLGPYYLQSEQWDRLVAMQEILLHHGATDPVAAMVELAQIHEVHRGDAGQAYLWYAEALKADPGHAALLAEAHRTAAATESYELLVALLDGLVLALEGPAAVAMRRVLAEVNDANLDRPHAAIEHWEAIRAAEGDAPGTLDALERLYGQVEDHDALLEVREAQLAAANRDGDLAAQALVLARIGQLHEESRRDEEAAHATYTRLLALETNNLAALRGLQRLAERSGDLVALAALVEQEQSCVDSPEDLARLQYLGGQIAARQGDIEGAIDRYAQVLATVPGQAEAMGALRGLLESAFGGRAAEVLEPHVRATESWPVLRRVLRLQAVAAETVAARVQHLREIARLDEHELADAAAAFDTWQQVIDADPTQTGAREEAERLAADLDRWPELAAHYARFALDGDMAGSAEQAVGYSQRLAHIAEQRLGDWATARAALEAVVAERGDDTASLVDLDRLVTRQQDWQALVDLCERQLSLIEGDAEASLALLFRMGGLWEEQLDNADEAVAVYRRARALDRDNVRAIDALERLFALQGRAEDLAALLDERIAEAEADADRVALGFRLGQVLENALGDGAGALARFAAVLAVDPAHAPTRTAVQARVSGDGDPELRLQAIEILEPVLVGAGAFDEVVAIQRVRLTLTDEPSARGAIHRAIAETCELQLGDAVAAFEAYAAGFRADPADAAMLAALERLASEADAAGELADVLQSVVDDPEAGALDPTVLANHRRRLADLYANDLGEAARAAQMHRSILADDPDDEQALAMLDGLLSGLDDHAGLAEVVLHRLDLAREPAAAAVLAFRLGALHEGPLGAPAEAIAVYQRIRADIDPDDLRAHVALERLYGYVGDPAALVEVLGDHAARLSDPAEARELSLRVARLQEDALGDAEQAVLTYRTLLEADAADSQALGELDRLYASLERPLELQEIIERRLAIATESADQDRFGRRLAALLAGTLGDLPAAVDAYAAVLKRNPADGEARAALQRIFADAPEVRLAVAAVLEPVFEGQGDPAGLRDLLRGTLDVIDDPDTRVATLRRIASIEEVLLDDPLTAFESLGEALRLSEADPSVLAELERLSDALDADAALADLLAEVVPLAPERAHSLWLQVARLAETRLSDPERAIEALEAALEIEPDDAVALAGLERLFTLADRPDALVAILGRQVDLADAAADRLVLLRRIAHLQAGPLDFPAAAIETWQRVLSEDDRDAEALAALERLLAGAGDWAALANQLEHRIGVAEDDQARAAAEFQLARLCETHLGEGDRAVGLYRQVLEVSPKHAGVREALGALFADEARCMDLGIERLAVAELLEPMYREQNDDRGLASVLSVRQSLTNDVLLKVELLGELAVLHEVALHDADSAFVARLEALGLAPDDLSNREEVLRLAALTYRWDDLASGLEGAAAEMADPEVRSALLMSLARIEEQHRGQDTRAREVYREVLQGEPGHKGAFDALVDLFTRTTSWEELVELHLATAADELDLEVRKAHYFKVCQLLEDVLDEPARAIDTYRAVLEIEPENGPAFEALRKGLNTFDRHEELAELLQMRLDHTQAAADRAPLRFELAALFERRLDDLDGAIEALRTVLADDLPDHGPSLEALERLLMGLDADDDRRRLVAEILEPIYARKGQWSDWVMAMEVRVEHEADPWQQVELLQKIAEVQANQLQAPEAAFAACARALELDFGNPELQARLDQLGLSLNAHEQLVAAYLGGIEHLSDLDAAVTLMMKVAGWLEGPLADAERAVQVLVRVLAVDDAHLGALDALERLYGQANQAAALVQVLERRAELADTDGERRALRVRAAHIHGDALGDAESAIATWRAVFDEDGSDLEALDALIGLYERTEQWSQVVITLRERLDLLPDDADRKPWLERIAHTNEVQLNDPEETILTWRTVLDSDARDVDALAALDRLYSREGRWGELIDLLEGERDALRDEDADGAAKIELRIAETLDHKLESVPQAIEAYGELLEVDAVAPAARAALERLLGDERWRLPAARVLEPDYQRRGATADLARVFELQLLDMGDPFERVELLKRLAHLRYDDLKHPVSAFDAYARAFSEAPADPELVDALHQLADELTIHEELARLMADQVTKAVDVSVVADLNRRLARLYEGRLNAPLAAVEAWEAVIEQDGYDAEALLALDRLHQQQQNWTGLISVLRRRVDLAEPEEASDLRFRLGYLLEAVEDDVPGALDLYRTVLLDDPSHVYSLEALERLAVRVEHRRSIADVLEPIYRDAQTWDKLAILTEMTIELAGDAHERARLWTEAAALRGGPLGDPAAAFDRTLRAFDEVPEDEPVRERLFQLGESQGAYEALVDALERVASRVNDPEVRLEDHLRAARWSRNRLEEQRRAVGHYLAALDQAPDCVEALDALEALHRASGDWAALAGVMQRKIDATFDLDDKRKLLLTLGQLAATRLNDRALAVSAYTDAAEIDESSGEALAELERLHTEGQDWPALLGVLERRASTTYDAEVLAGIHRRMAELARDQIGDPGLAAEAFERVVELDHDDATALAALRALYGQLEDWDRLQQVLVKTLAMVDGDAERRGLLSALGDNAEHRLGRPEEAIEYLRQVFAHDPADAALADRLAALYLAAGRPFDLVETLREHLEAAGERNAPERRIMLRVRLAEVAERDLHDADLAIETLNGVLELAPDHPQALTVLARLYERSGEWARAVEALERSAANATVPSEKAAALRQLGRLALGPLDRADLARTALNEALSIEPDDAQTLDALLDLARREGDQTALLELTGRKVARLQGPERRTALIELARLRGEAGDAAGRLADLEAARALDPEDLVVTEQIIDAYLDAGRTADARPLVEAAVARLQAARRFKDLLGYRFKLGRLAEAAGDDDAAFEAYQACFEQDATYVPNLVALGKLHFRRDNQAEALKVLQTVLLHQTRLDSAGRVDVFYHLGRVRQALGEDRKARDMYNRALGLDPDFAAAKAALEGL